MLAPLSTSWTRPMGLLGYLLWVVSVCNWLVRTGAHFFRAPGDPFLFSIPSAKYKGRYLMTLRLLNATSGLVRYTKQFVTVRQRLTWAPCPATRPAAYLGSHRNNGKLRMASGGIQPRGAQDR